MDDCNQQAFVKMFDKRFKHLEKAFKDIYLIRNEREVKIVDEYRVALKFKTGSPIELIDIIGNAKEICKAEKKIYKLPVKQKYVLRGGSCVDSILSSRLTTRHPVFSIKQPYIGLRLVVKKKGK